MKKHIAKFAIIFFIVIALLTYFSKTIDNLNYSRQCLIIASTPEKH